MRIATCTRGGEVMLVRTAHMIDWNRKKNIFYFQLEMFVYSEKGSVKFLLGLCDSDTRIQNEYCQRACGPSI